MVVDRKAPIPLYYQIAEDLRVKYGDEAAGTRLPSEPELAKLYGVSRGTIKQALDELEKAGRIERQRGKGTFVTQPRIQQPGTKIQSYTEQVSLHGYETSAQVLEFKIVQAGAKAGARLRLSPEARVYRIERLRYIGQEPLVTVTSYLPVDRVGPLSPGDAAESLYLALERRGLRPTRVQDSFAAGIASPAVAQVLQIVEGSPVLCTERLGFVQDEVMEYSSSVIRAKDYVLTIETVEEPTGSISFRRGFSLPEEQQQR
jgi:GntR family transcriptional regulator